MAKEKILINSENPIATGIAKIEYFGMSINMIAIPTKLLIQEIIKNLFSLFNITIHWFPQMKLKIVKGSNRPNALR